MAKRTQATPVAAWRDGEGPTESTWVTKTVKVRRNPVERSGGRTRRSGFLRLPRADRTQKVTLRVVYRGSHESYWLVEARGEHQVFPGWLCLDDVMARVLSER